VQRAKQPYRAPIASSIGAGQDNLSSSLMRPDQLERTGLTDVRAVERLFQKSSAGRALSERDEMGVAMVASLQLLHHFFVEKPSSGSSSINAGLA
jgi:hypothetical protein